MKNQRNDLEETEDDIRKQMEVRHQVPERLPAPCFGRRFCSDSSASPGLEQPETGERAYQGGAAEHDRGELKGKRGHVPSEDRGVDEEERQTHGPKDQGGQRVSSKNTTVLN